MLIIRGVNVFPSQIDDPIMQSGVFAPLYPLEIERASNLDALTMFVEVHAGIDNAAAQRAVTALEHLVKARVEISVTVKIASGDSIPRSLGKAHHVRDKRKSE